jgi:transposase
MAESTTIIAFDVHAASVVAGVLLPGHTAAALHHLSPEVGAIRRFVERVRREARSVRCYYEAGPTGFGLYRHLTEHGIACEVIAPSRIPKRGADRVKTDRRDAARLAVLARAGALTAVHVPTDQEEAARDLLRCREALVTDLLRARHRLKKFLLRQGRRFTETRSWSKRHYGWIRQQTWSSPIAAQTHQAYLRAVDDIDAQLTVVNAEVRALLECEPLRTRAMPLRCFRGVDDLTALTIASELGDPNRFPTARSIMAYVGLVPSEFSSGERRQRGAITKTGNAHVRRVLIEAAWHYRLRPARGPALEARQRGAAPEVVRHAWTAPHRLHGKYRRLLARGKSSPLVTTAIARELIGFLWAALRSDLIGRANGEPSIDGMRQATMA